MRAVIPIDRGQRSERSRAAFRRSRAVWSRRRLDGFTPQLGCQVRRAWRQSCACSRPCMGLSKSSTYFTHSPLPSSFIPVSLFDLESRFFAPTHTCRRPTRTGAVKVGRRSTLAARSVVSRPRLDRPEHGGTLVVVGMTRPRGARCRGTRNSRRNLVSGGSQ